ncbi:MAG: hypothetical protein ACTHMS_00290 [Jatrophihabitans sp.]|uniref:hypothetical protein n=1 Tax=Jatrophihabitans sp. TaxID=1932789 RepID=UPI003F7D727E
MIVLLIGGRGSVNIDFDAHPGFSWYVVLLAFSGVVMVGLATRRTSLGLRLVNGIVGAGFVGYAFYLAFLFTGGTYIIFLKAFILPVLLLLRTLRARTTPRPARAMPAHPGAGQPGAVQPGAAMPGVADAAGPSWAGPVHEPTPRYEVPEQYLVPADTYVGRHTAGQ